MFGLGPRGMYLCCLGSQTSKKTIARLRVAVTHSFV